MKETLVLTSVREMCGTATEKMWIELCPGLSAHVNLPDLVQVCWFAHISTKRVRSCSNTLDLQITDNAAVKTDVVKFHASTYLWAVQQISGLSTHTRTCVHPCAYTRRIVSVMKIDHLCKYVVLPDLCLKSKFDGNCISKQTTTNCLKNRSFTYSCIWFAEWCICLRLAG